MNEVDRVQEVADADQMELDLDPVDNISDQMAKAHEITDEDYNPITEDSDLSEKIEDTKKSFKDFMVETPTEDGEFLQYKTKKFKQNMATSQSQ